MSLEGDWERIRGRRKAVVARGGMGVLRLSLLFGTVAAAFTLLVTPYLADRTTSQWSRAAPAGLDFMNTGSVARGGNTYTMRRSVLQASNAGVCIIRANGSRSGDC